MTKEARGIDSRPVGWGPALAWAACVLLMAVMTVVFWPKGALSTDVLELLPEAGADTRTRMIATAAVEASSDRVVWAVRSRSGEDEAGKKAAEALFDALKASGSVLELTGRMPPEEQRAWLADQRRAVVGLLSDNVVEDLTEKEGRGQKRFILSQLYSPVGGVTADEWTADPFLLTRTAVFSPADGRLALKDGWLSAKDEKGHTWRLMTGRVPPSATNGAGLEQWTEREAAMRAEVARTHDAVIVGQGVVWYSRHAAAQAERDVTRLGSLSLVLLALFLWGAFRSVRPVFLCLLSVSVGALCGTAATLAVFGSIHAVTLVMCLSLIGISADYTTYYLVRRRWAGGTESPSESLARLRPSLLHALLTTCIAYGLMLAAPLPGLRQLALFAVCGLTGAWLTVVLVFPLLVRGFPVRALSAHAWFTGYVSGWAHRRRWTRLLAGGLACFMAFGFLRLEVNDDLAALQTPPERLAVEEKIISDLIGRGFSQTWFAVTGDDAGKALARLDALRPVIRMLERDGLVTDAVVPPLRSDAVQTTVLAALERLTPAMLGPLSAPCLTGGGGCVPYGVVSPDDWLRSRSGAPYASLFLTLEDGRTAVIVPVTLRDGADASRRAAEAVAGLEETYWIHRRADFMALFETFRLGLAGLIAIGCAALCVMLMMLFGVRRGVRATLPIAVALAAGLAATGLVGMPVNLFSLFALVLVMGIGVDYTVFFQSERAASDQVFYAMAVALGSTLLSLGILVFSETPAVRNFGLVLAVGVLTAFLLAPAATDPAEEAS